jgi:peptidoglycan/LPS O-acetylase OafA/YrhL
VTEDKRAFPQLTGVRALAAAMVYLHHYRPQQKIVGHVIFSMCCEMHAGVSIFFVLSGFLIYLRHSGPAALHRVALIRYAFHRFARIYPMYFLVVVGMGIWSWAASPASYPVSRLVSDLLLQLSFIRGFSDQYRSIGVGQGWTLTVEVTFYVLFPLLLLLIRRRGFFPVLLMVWGAGLLLWGIGELIHYHNYFRPFRFMMIYTFFGRAGDFFVGMIVADHVMRLKDGEQSSRRLPYCTVAGLLGIAGSLYTLASLERGESVEAPFHPVGAVVYLLLLPPFIGALLYGLVTERSWAAGFLGSRVLVILGASSYCFYLIHVGGPDSLVNKWVIKLGTIPGYAMVADIAILLWMGIEEPLRRMVLAHHLFRRTGEERLPA